MKSTFTTDTIAAIATPEGNGALGIVRMTGSQSWHLASKAINKKLNHAIFSPNRSSYVKIVDNDGTILDHSVLTVWEKPSSYTGERMAEFTCHGGRTVLKLVLQRLLQLGAQIAPPGEFSRRAFSNGKLSLDQAEAVASLIEAKTGFAARKAAQILDGGLTNRIEQLKQNVLGLLGEVEIALDFVEEDLEQEIAGDSLSLLNVLRDSLERLLKQARAGMYIRNGAEVVIAGPPNVGKSTLLNVFAGYQRAIVSEIPGTTRDYLDLFQDWQGLPVHLYDTAGLRDTVNSLENEGARRSLELLKKADCILWLESPPGYEDPPVEWQESGKLIRILNKIDIEESRPKNYDSCISAREELGIHELQKLVIQRIAGDFDTDELLLFELRQVQLLTLCREHLEIAASLLKEQSGLELVAVELRTALDNLGEITGQVTSDDILSSIFTRFCVGK